MAKHAGVSETIVSYVVNNNRYVAEDKRKRVEKAIAELNYRPNVIARALRKKTSHQILLIGDAITDEYYSQMLTMLDRYAYDLGYLVSLCKYHDVDSYLARVLSNQFDGIIINSGDFKEEYILRIAEAGIPVVLFLGKKYEKIPSGVATIDSGLFAGAIKGLKRLSEKGARKIIYLAEPLKKEDLQRDIRYLAFRQVLMEQGQSEEQIELQAFTGHGSEKWEAEFIKHLKENPKVDAIFARNDGLAAVAVKAVQSLGYKVPQDLMVLGVDNAGISQLMSPSLTTICLQKEEMSKAAVEMIVAMKQGQAIEIRRVFETTLIERESTAKSLKSN